EAAINNVNQDLSQQNTQAFALILFNGFLAQNPENADFQLPDLSGNINNAISQQLNNLANRYIKFVEVDFGLDAYQTDSEQEQMDLTVSVRKRLFNDRLLIRLDGKASSETGPDQGSTQTFLDNVTVEYSLTPSGRFKLKFYNQRDFDDFIGGTALKVGGALVFSKDFNTWRWKKRQ
ncbi:MAG: translocation/assembly module TamB domain-containing protein, partial [Bacteroidota bacterium]